MSDLPLYKMFIGGEYVPSCASEDLRDGVRGC